MVRCRNSWRVACLGQEGTDLDTDPATRRTIETILATEEEHANDLVSLLEEFGN